MFDRTKKGKFPISKKPLSQFGETLTTPSPSPSSYADDEFILVHPIHHIRCQRPYIDDVSYSGDDDATGCFDGEASD